MKKTQNRIISPHAGWRLCLYVLLLALGSCSSCKKEVNALPDATQTGANTFGCLIDGKAWVPRGRFTVPNTPPIIGGYRDPVGGRGKHSVSLYLTQDDRSSMAIYVKAVIKAGRYSLSFDTDIDPIYATTNNYGLYTIDGFMVDDPDYNYVTTSKYVGYVDFTIADTITKQLSGTFAFDAIDAPSKRTIRVTDGRFDLNQLKRP